MSYLGTWSLKRLVRAAAPSCHRIGREQKFHASPKFLTLLLLATSWAMPGPIHAGDLEPLGPPAPTMVTLQDIYDSLVDLVVVIVVVGLQSTGQTECWDESGTPISCAGTGQDGEYQAGVSTSPRFTANGDGSVTDNQTGLIWLQDAECFGRVEEWTTALFIANTLASGSCGLTDGSVAGDWRLPNVTEQLSLIDYGQSRPALTPGHPFSNVRYGYGAIEDAYWSSTSSVGDPSRAWYVHFYEGATIWASKSYIFTLTPEGIVWPVRDGP